MFNGNVLYREISSLHIKTLALTEENTIRWKVEAEEEAGEELTPNRYQQ